MMFGYATNETPLYIPLTLALSHALVMELAAIRREGKLMTYLRPDSKSQVTVEYDENNHPVRVETIVVSTQHDEFIDAAAEGITQEQADKRMLDTIRADVQNILIPRVKANLPEHLRPLLDDNYRLLVNPTGKFVIGGPHGDTGLTGRKIIVDTYGGHGAHGGGAFSGKDPSKVDRSGAYAARHIAKNLVAAGVAERVLVQVAYAEISARVNDIFDMTPHGIEKRLKLRQPIYLETASYGHMGRTPRVVTKHFKSQYDEDLTLEVELFTWEKLDYVDTVREAFNI
jgi:S-adenosylmethionine synthetase